MSGRTIPAAAVEVAAELVRLFDRDRELVLALNEASDRLQAGNDQLTAGLSAEALRAIYGPTGPDLGLSGRKPPVLEHDSPVSALEQVADSIRRAFIDYQNVAESRRQLGFEVGDANARLIAAMTAAGFSEQQARQANVRALATGSFELSEDTP
jgi:hypothetical protein